MTVAEFLSSPLLERRDDVIAIPSPCTLGPLSFWYDPTAPHVRLRMECARCGNLGMLIGAVDLPKGRGYCMSRCSEARRQQR